MPQTVKTRAEAARVARSIRDRDPRALITPRHLLAALDPEPGY
jgi:hypothetical protein